MNSSVESIELATHEWRAEKESFERRVGLVVGTIDKVGLAPGLLATFFSWHTLREISPGWGESVVGSVAYAMPFLYFPGILAHLLVLDMDRGLKLLELVLLRKRSASGIASGGKGSAEGRPCVEVGARSSPGASGSKADIGRLAASVKRSKLMK